MKKKYEDPLFEIVKIQISNDLLSPSTSFTPEDEIREDVVNDD